MAGPAASSADSAEGGESTGPAGETPVPVGAESGVGQDLSRLLATHEIRHRPQEIHALFEAGKMAGLTTDGILAFTAAKLKQKRDQNQPAYSIKLLLIAISSPTDIRHWAAAQRNGSYFVGNTVEQPASQVTANAVRSHLADLSTLLRAIGYEEIAGALHLISGAGENEFDVEDLDQRLQTLECEMVQIAAGRLTEDESVKLRQELNDRVSPHRGKMTSDQLRNLEQQCISELIRTQAGLPRLSLFCRPEASRAAA